MTLGELARLGVRELRFCCTARDCAWCGLLALDRLILSYGKGCQLRTLARAARCRRCNGHGAHIEPVGLGRERQEPVHDDWMRAVRLPADRGFMYGYPDRRGQRKR